MLKINLATRPFYNERVIDTVLLLLGVGALVLMVVGGQTLFRLSNTYTDVVRTAQLLEAEASAVTEEMMALNQSVSEDELETLRLSAAEANRLIDQRVFSWTELFNVIEQTLPDRVMLTGLRPTGTSGSMTLTIGVIGERITDIEQFIEELEATGSVDNVLARQEQRTEDGMYSAQLIGEFRGRTNGSDSQRDVSDP